MSTSVYREDDEIVIDKAGAPLSLNLSPEDAADVYRQLKPMVVGPEREAYFRTVLVVEVLTATQAWNGDLSELGEDVTNGDASGTVLTRVVEQCSEAEIADLLKAQGSDPSFLITDWSA